MLRTSPGSSLVGRFRRLGIVPRLLMASLLAVVMAVFAVQAWTWRIVGDEQTRAAQRALDIGMAQFREMLKPMGTEWRLEEDGGLSLGGHRLAGRDDIVDAVRRVTGDAATVFAGDTRIATSVARPDGTRAVGTRLADGPARDAAFVQGRTFRGENEILGAAHLTLYEPIRDNTGRQLGMLFVGVPLADHHAVMNRLLREGLIAGLVVIAVVGALRWFALHASMRPLKGLAASVRSIAAGNLDQAAPCAERGDQLGEIGRAIEVLRAGALEARNHEIKASADRAARDRRQEAMDRHTQDFGTSVSGVLATLGGSADGMRAAAHDMADAAGRTRTDMIATAGEAEHSSQNLANVAAATEELTASVGEISRQVGEAARSAQDAAAQARTTDHTVQGLSESAGQIGEVVRLISDIAEQTNLLALNATIEAARAGEAGKGFAVVAGEVKALAAQTAQATSRIGAQVAAIQSATGNAVLAVRGVAGAIDRVSEVASAIAEAVEQQGAATREIADQVQQVAQMTEGATQAMRGASDLAQRSEQDSRKLLGTADDVSRVSGTLREEVDHFLTAMRQGRDGGDRRRYERVSGHDAPATLHCATFGTLATRIVDISLGGAALRASWACPVGHEVLVELPGPGASVSARVVDARDGLMAVAFGQNPAVLARVDGALDVITAGTGPGVLAA